MERGKNARIDVCIVNDDKIKPDETLTLTDLADKHTVFYITHTKLIDFKDK